MTPHAMAGDREHCLAAGMDGYIGKPIRKKDLLDALDQVRPGTASPIPTHALAPANRDRLSEGLGDRARS
jgi:CheY-like chemotaxis protein